MAVVSKTKKVSSLFSSAIKASTTNCSIKVPKLNKNNAKNHQKTKSKLSYVFINNPSSSSHSVNSASDMSREISTLLNEGTSSSAASLPGSSPVNNVISPWVQSLQQNNIILRRKEILRDRNEKWVFKNSQSRRFDRLVKTCNEKLGSADTHGVFKKLGRKTGIKEYNALIALCIENSKKAENEEFKSEQTYKAYEILMTLREQGFQLEEGTYGQVLTHLIDMKMAEDFKFVCEIIRQENPTSLPRLAFYEMLLWVKLDDEVKIKELCDFVATDTIADNSITRENYLLALCEGERKKEVLMLLEIIDITKISSKAQLTKIFSSLARLSLELYAKKFILALKKCGANSISELMYDYAVSIPNLEVEDVISKFKRLHEEWGVVPASVSYEKLIQHCCNLLKVHVALDIVDHMIKVGLTVSLVSFHLILQKCDEGCDYNLVHRIYSIIRQINLTPENETFRIMINLSVRMKDFESAYNMIADMEKLNMEPSTSIYNTIMAAHFREKNIQAGLQVLKKMEHSGGPDSLTLSYLIANCDQEEEIKKYHERVKLLKPKQISKHVFMALINAYVSCGQIEKAKQVVFEKGIHVKNLNEVKSVLISALACNGHVCDALNMYEEMKHRKNEEEMKQAQGHSDPRTTLCLIENLRSKKHLAKLLDLLEDLEDRDYWIEGCSRIVVYGVQHKDLRFTVDLMKRLKNNFCDDDIAAVFLFDEAFCKIAEMEQVDLQFGLDLLRSIKEELDVRPSRQSLDFLLYACIRVKDLKTARLIWNEYAAARLAYNGLAYLRMYQAFLACGDKESARKVRKKVPLDDPHIVCVLKACQKVYDKPKKTKK